MKRLSFYLLVGLALLLFHGCTCDCDELSTCFEPDPCEDCNEDCAAYIQTELHPSSFSFSSPIFAQGSINENTKEITIQVPFGTDLSSLSETFRFSRGTQLISYELEITVAEPILPSVMEPWFDVFAGQGIGAALFYTNSRSVHFNRGGTQFATYIPNNGGSFGAANFLEDWGGNTYNIPFSAVGSALQIRTSLRQFFSGASGEGNVQVLFNAAGTEVVFYNAGYGFSEVYPMVDS